MVFVDIIIRKCFVAFVHSFLVAALLQTQLWLTANLKTQDERRKAKEIKKPAYPEGSHFVRVFVQLRVYQLDPQATAEYLN